MPNYCDYTMRIVGDKKDRDRAVEIIQSDYNGTKDDPVHLWRVFEAIVYDEYNSYEELLKYISTLDNNNGNTFVVTKEQYEQEDFIEIGNFDCEFSI